MSVTRRSFLELCGLGTGAAVLAGCRGGSRALAPLSVESPLRAYPARGWEKVYLDQYAYDSSFTWVCSPNCTHECRMRAFVRNGVMLRSEQNYDCDRISDLYGNRASAAWNPRGCPNGFTFQRRLYGPHRLRHPIVRRGWKAWADAGFPELDAASRTKYRFDDRGNDEFVKATWDEAFGYATRAMVAIATRYSGDEGKRRLLAQGYPPEMLEHWGGAGTRTFKFRGGMGLLGVMGKYGMYRFANGTALLDAKIRGVSEKDAKGGRLWSNYTWHGDQAPGHPFVHGLQASDTDFADLRSTKLHVHLGKNLVENKRADNHFFSECMERGAKIVVITPEYSPSSTKADYWIPIRPNTDAALLLGVSRVLMEERRYDAAFVKQFTDLPLLVRTDTLRRLRADEVFPGHVPADLSNRPSMRIYGLTKEQREKLGDYVVWDQKSGRPQPLSRDDVGKELAGRGLDPALEGKFKVRLARGGTVNVMPLFEAYKLHLRDYDLDTVAEICGTPRELIRRLADDLATITPAAIHIGEGINHWFHATESNRATYLPLMLTGNLGKPGTGSHTWAGNYKAAIFQGSAETGPGFKGWVAEDPFHPNLDPGARARDLHPHAYTYDEEVGYWNYGDQPLIVDTPKHGRRCFTGKTHMPTPTKLMWFCNVNLINNAKWAYEMIKNVDPKVELIMSTDIESNGTVEYCDIALPASSWVETETYEITAACSNPFFQIWKGGLAPTYDSRDDVLILAGMAKKLGELIGDPRLTDYWKFAHEKKTEVYIQRLLEGSTTGNGYRVEDILSGKYGEPGAAMALFRTYPRVPFYEQIQESHPFFTATGRLQAYNDEPEVIEYGENFIVHREGPEATPYLPNVIVSSNPLVRPEDYGIPASHMGAGERQVRNIRLPWKRVKATRNPLWEAGYQFFCLTPKSRHSTHSSWMTVDWHMIWNNPFGDPYRADRRQAGEGEHAVYMNPQAARDLGIEDGDYVYIDANPADRPYVGARPGDPFYKVARLMVRLRYNAAYPYNIVMMKHAPWISTDRSVRGHETRPDGRALAEGTQYQASFRYGSQQSITRGWAMPMHQLDSLFHKAKARMGFLFGFEGDNHGINTVPKETLVRVTKAEAGGLGGQGKWKPATTGRREGGESAQFLAYLRGELTRIG